MLRYQLSHDLKLPDLENDLRAGVIEVGHLPGENFITLLEAWVQVANIGREVIVELFEVLVEVFVEDLGGCAL